MPRNLYAARPIPSVLEALSALTVEDLKWYASLLERKVPTRKAEIMAPLVDALTDPAEIRRLFGRLTKLQQQVIAEVVHKLDGRYERMVLEAKYPGSQTPINPRTQYSYNYYSFGSGKSKPTASVYDALFFYDYQFGYIIPHDLAANLRSIAPPPPPFELRGHDKLPVSRVLSLYNEAGVEPDYMVAETEQAVFHDLAATLYLINEGKVKLSAATRQPGLVVVRALRERLLIADYFADQAYERAEDAMRPLALIMLVQAAKWAELEGSSMKLALTKSGQALLSGAIQAKDIRHAWQRWVKTDLLDELSRIRAIKGQQAKGVRLTKPAERRQRLVTALEACPPGRWVELETFFRYLRAERLSPQIEREGSSGLSIGYGYYDGEAWADYYPDDYWEGVIGSYLRALLWEYAGTLGLIEPAYVAPEDVPAEVRDRMPEGDYDFLSRYDGLLGFRVTPLGAYALGLTEQYTPPPPPRRQGPPVLQLLPNLDIVITDPGRAAPNDRVFLERIGAAEHENVYHLSRERLLDAMDQGLSLAQVKDFLVNSSGLEEAGWPQTVRVFFEDIERRLDLVRDAGRAWMLESDDLYVLMEIAHAPEVRGGVLLATAGERTVLLVPEEKEAAVRRQLRKLGYLPRRERQG